jgi:hypothetical protein
MLAEDDEAPPSAAHNSSAEVRMTPVGRRILASPIGSGTCMASDEAEHHQRHKSPRRVDIPLPKAHKRSPASQRELRNQARINELEETVDELEKKLRGESTEKHELTLQIRKLKASLAEQQQLVISFVFNIPNVGLFFPPLEG